MAINMDKPQLWKADIVKSVDFYNDWFIRFAPKAYKDMRVKTIQQVEDALTVTLNLLDFSPENLISNPKILPILRMCTAPPIARDRLIGLAGVTPNLVKSMELNNKIPPRMDTRQVKKELSQIQNIFNKLLDVEIFPWINEKLKANKETINRAATVIADRLCGSIADPIVRNAQEVRQLAAIETWLVKKGYSKAKAGKDFSFEDLKPGEFSLRLNVKINLLGLTKTVNIPVDVVIKPKSANQSDFPILVEAKSAGDFTNTNKWRKEEAMKMSQLKANYGDDIKFALFLCGYFDSGYLGYEAAEGIDWIWKHRISDFKALGV